MSTIKTETLSNTAGSKTVPVSTVVDGSAKAWVNFNGTGTVAIRASFNVSSITDNGTGDYTVNFTNAMTDANYSTYVGGQGPSTSSLANLTALYSAPASNTLVSPSISSFRFGSYSFQGNASDSAFLCVSIFR